MNEVWIHVHFGHTDFSCDGPVAIDCIHFDIKCVEFLLWEHILPGLTKIEEFFADLLVDLKLNESFFC